MLIPPAFIDRLRAHVSMVSVVRQNVRLVRSGRDWKGCCPFHHEKTPSFYVYADHYHCFGCGAHGDAIRYVSEIYGLSFTDAVVSLARQVGLSIPKEDLSPQQVQQRKQFREEKDQLYALLETAKLWYHKNLYQPANKEALDYLYGRGLRDETIKQFCLGWAPRQGNQLKQFLLKRQFTPQQMEKAGILRASEQGKEQGEWFFGRVMFPILDERGRVVSFGGRILGDGQPKYLNGRETPLFSKRTILFNYHGAWQALKAARARRENCDMMVVEGYLDVIALSQGGFPNAVAPLGTALTEEQMDKIWRVSSRPLICFDGDGAGRKAIVRSAEIVLSKLDSDHTVRYVLLPQGDDPDSFLQTHGFQETKQLFEKSHSLSDVLFTLLNNRINPQEPEERAKLRKKLLDMADLIPDKILASEYRKALSDRFFETYRFKKGGRASNRRAFGVKNTEISPPIPSTENLGRQRDLERQREMLLLLLNCPLLVGEVEDLLCRLPFDGKFLPFRDELLDLSAAEDLPEQSADLRHWLKVHHKENILTPLAPLPKQNPSEPYLIDEARARWWDFYMLMKKEEMIKEVEHEMTQFFKSESQDAEQWKKLTQRLQQVKQWRQDMADER